MNKQLNKIVCALVAIMTASSVGCGNGFRSGNSSGANESASGGKDNIAESQQAAVESEKAMESATVALSSMTTVSGTIDLSIFEPGQSGVLAPIIAKLKPIFDNAFAKVEKVKASFDRSKFVIAAQMAKLNPSDPMYQLLAKELETLTNLETKFHEQVAKLADKLMLVNTKIDGLIAQITAAIPFPGVGVILGVLIDTYIVDDVKALITDLHDRLMAL